MDHSLVEALEIGLMLLPSIHCAVRILDVRVGAVSNDPSMSLQVELFPSPSKTTPALHIPSRPDPVPIVLQ